MPVLSLKKIFRHVREECETRANSVFIFKKYECNAAVSFL